MYHTVLIVKAFLQQFEKAEAGASVRLDVDSQ